MATMRHVAMVVMLVWLRSPVALSELMQLRADRPCRSGRCSGPERAYSSATPIARLKDGRTDILVAGHAVSTATGVWVAVENKWFPCSVVKYEVSERLDVGLVRARLPKDLDVYEFADSDPPVGSSLALNGFGAEGHKFHHATVKVVAGPPAKRLIEIDHVVGDGDSGGPLMSGGRIAGMIVYRDGVDGHGSAYPASALAAWVEQVCGYRLIRAPARYGVLLPVPPPPVLVMNPPSLVATDPPSCPAATDLAGAIDLIEKRLAVLESDGASVNSGLKSVAASTALLQSSLNTLKSRIDGLSVVNGRDGKDGTVTVILVDTDGKELQRAEDVKSGSVVRLNIRHVLKEK